MAPIRDPRQLPAKEEALFRTLLSQYETKQFKKAVKTADSILKKFPDHGQTISLKALVVFHTPASPETPSKTVETNEAEGLELAKLGVRKDSESQLCWHILGMLHRSQKNYLLASKSFNQALKADPNSLQILRDNSHLSLHLRNFPVHLANRITLLQLRPNERRNWVALAVAYGLNGEPERAEEVLKGFEEMVKDPEPYDYEESELILFRVHLLIETGKYTEALAALEAGVRDRRVVDSESSLKYKATALNALGKKEEAEDCYRALLEQNPDCHSHYKAFMANKGLDLDNLTEETRSKALRSFELISSLYPRAGAPRRLALNIASGDDFRSLTEAYISAGLERGVPSLFSDLKALYSDPSKRQTIGDIVESLLTKLETSNNFTGGEDHIQPPTTLLWTYYFLALHYAHPASNRTPDYERSLSLLAKAIEHTPTLPELYTARARVLKYAGDAWGAAVSMEEARRLDGQDRFLNSKAGKYWLRAGQIDMAVDVLGLFTKKEAPSPAADLVDMQCLWFLLEDARAHASAGQLAMALKRYDQIEKVFGIMDDDQFDFHGYCFRKFTLRAYLDLLKWEKDLYATPSYVEAALAASSIYVRLSDDPSLAKSSESSSNPDISTADKKKAEQKAKKAAAKAAAAKKDAKPDKKTANAVVEPAPPKDEDPVGAKMLATSEPLEVASKLLKRLELSDKAGKDAKVWIGIYEVAVRRKRYLQAARALNKAHVVSPSFPALQTAVVDFHLRTSSLTDVEAPISSVVTSTLASLLPSKDPLAQIKSTLSAHPTSAAHILASARSLALLDQPSSDIESVVFQLLNEQVAASVSLSVEALAFLEGRKSERAGEFRQASKQRWPIATAFATAEEAKQLTAQWRESEKVEADKRKENGNGVPI